MGAIFGITFPIYGIIAIGYLVVRKGWFSASDMRVLGRCVMNLALPALLFGAVATRDLAQAFHIGYALIFLAGGLATLSISFIWFSATGIDKARRALAVMGSTCPNSGFVGFPIMLLTFPDIAATVLAMNMLVENLVLIPICLALVDAARSKEQSGLIRRLAVSMMSVLRRPMMIGLLAGLAVSLSGLPLPAAVDRLVSVLASSAAALSLLAIGGALVGLPLRGNRKLAIQIATAKLLLHPAMIALVAFGVTVTGLVALPTDLKTAVILSGAMPMLGIYVVLAQEQGLEGAASIAMLVATTGSFLTLSLLLAMLA